MICLGMLQNRPDSAGSIWLTVQSKAICVMAAWLFIGTGCTSLRDYVNNGFKVGPDFERPTAGVSEHWIDSADQRVHSDPVDLTQWWHTFNDPVLNDLVTSAYEQNLTLREAGFRVLQARAALGIARGFLLPQEQSFDGAYSKNQFSHAGANREFLPQGSFSNWQFGFNLAWEIDFWGRLRRMIESERENFNASIEDYDAVLVTLIGDVAETYVKLRIVEQQLEYVAANTKLQTETLGIATARFQGGNTTDLDVEQATSVLAQTESQTPQLEIQRRQLTNHLCVLLGMPVHDLQARLGKAKIPSTSPEVVIGIPADLLGRRPDVRQQERLAAAECARIGFTMGDLYPAITINGSIGYAAQDFSGMFNSNAFQGAIGPSFHWRILHYGRILNNIKRREAAFEGQVAKYQQTVLKAGEEAENALVAFLRSQQQAQRLAVSVDAAEKAAKVALVQYQGGLTDFNRVSLIQQNLVAQQNLLAQAQGNIAVGLVQLYRALGGGWEIRDSEYSTQAQAGGQPEVPQPQPYAPPAPANTPVVPAAPVAEKALEPSP